MSAVLRELAGILAAVGLIVPPLVGIATRLTPVAALGLVTLMIGAGPARTPSDTG